MGEEEEKLVQKVNKSLEELQKRLEEKLSRTE